MARPRQRNLVEKLADVGEEAIQRFGSAPGADRVLGALNSMRDRLDEMQKRLRGLEDLDKRLAAVEKRLDKLEGKGQSSSGTSARKGSSSSSATKRKSSGSS